jgi:hypothetical protein
MRLCFHRKEVVEVGLLPLPYFEWAVVLYEALYRFISTSHSYNHLIILTNLNEESPSSIGVDTFLVLSHKE